MKLFILSLLLLIFYSGNAQYVKKGIGIILSTKKYHEAEKLAEAASVKLKLIKDLRNLIPHVKNGLTWTKKQCAEYGEEYPAYYSRGRYDDGAYISIEYSDAFEGFTKGYYMVVVASGDKITTAPVIKKAKKFYPTAYVKETNIYAGCMH